MRSFLRVLVTFLLLCRRKGVKTCLTKKKGFAGSMPCGGVVVINPTKI